MISHSPRRALVTGAAGFLGRHVSLAFARAGWQVLGIGNGTLGADDQARLGLHRWVDAAIDAETVQDLIAASGMPDVVVHAAGGSSVRAAVDDPERDFQRTVGGTAELLKALRHSAPAARLVLTSSAAVYGNDHPNPIPETARLAPISAYGRHKCLAEELCLEAATQGQPVAIVRFFSLYGAGLRKQLFWDLWNKISGGGHIVLGGTGGETRDFLHVCDAAELLLHMVSCASAEAPAVVNGGTGHPTTIREAATVMERLCACDAKIVFDGVVRIGDPVHLVASVERLAVTGFRPRIAFVDGLADYAAWAYGSARSACAAPLIHTRFMDIL